MDAWPRPRFQSALGRSHLRKPVGGLSLIECILAFFMISCGILVLVQLYDSSFRHSMSIEARHQVTLMTEEVADAVREWGSQSANFASSWAIYDNTEFTDPRFPGVRSRVRVAPAGREIFSPFQAMPGSRRIEASIVPVRVESMFENRVSTRVILMTYVGEPPRPGLLSGTPPAVAVNLVAGTDPVAPDGTLDFEARLTDNTGQTIQGVTFTWTVLPETGNALIETITSEGDRAQLVHRYPVSAALTHVAGTIKVEARARYGGQDFVGESGVIHLL